MSVTAAGLKVAGLIPMLPSDEFTRTMGFGLSEVVVHAAAADAARKRK